jgi:6-methylsalicylate decarboxylase
MVMGRLHDYAPKNIAEVAPDGIDYELARLYYDIAGTAYPPAIAALTSSFPLVRFCSAATIRSCPCRKRRDA